MWATPKLFRRKASTEAPFSLEDEVCCFFGEEFCVERERRSAEPAMTPTIRMTADTQNSTRDGLVFFNCMKEKIFLDAKRMNLPGFIVSLIVLTGHRVVNRFYSRFLQRVAEAA